MFSFFSYVDLFLFSDGGLWLLIFILWSLPKSSVAVDKWRKKLLEYEKALLTKDAEIEVLKVEIQALTSRAAFEEKWRLEVVKQLDRIKEIREETIQKGSETMIKVHISWLDCTDELKSIKFHATFCLSKVFYLLLIALWSVAKWSYRNWCSDKLPLCFSINQLPQRISQQKKKNFPPLRASLKRSVTTWDSWLSKAKWREAPNKGWSNRRRWRWHSMGRQTWDRLSRRSICNSGWRRQSMGKLMVLPLFQLHQQSLRDLW